MLGELLAIVTVLCVILSNVLFRKIDGSVSPFHINAFRTSFGGLIFLFVAIIGDMFMHSSLIPPLLWILMLVSIVFGQIIGDTAYFQTQKMIGTTSAMSITTTFPIFTLFLSIIILAAQFSFTYYIAVLLVVIGILTLIKGKELQLKKEKEQETAKSEQTQQISAIEISKLQLDLETKQPRSKVLIAAAFGLTSSFACALGIVLLQYTLEQVANITNSPETSSMFVNAVRFPFAGIILIGLASRVPAVPIKKWDRKLWAILFLASILGTAFGAFFYTEATRLAGATFVSLIGASSPIFAIPIAYLLNKEKTNKLALFGVLITVSGILLTFV